MRITSCPEEYCGALAPVVYTVGGADADEILEVRITGQDEETYGIKRLHGETDYKVNIASYIERQISVRPLPADETGFIKADGRSFAAQIRIEDEVSPMRTVVGGTLRCKDGRVLSNAPAAVRLAPGERDEMAFIAPVGAVVATATIETSSAVAETVELAGMQGDGTLWLFGFGMQDAEKATGRPLGDCRYITVEINGEGGIIASRRYRIVPQNSSTVRIGWQNPYGQVDYFTCRLLAESVVVEKSKVRTGNGYAVTGMAGETRYRLASECETKATIGWLAEILSAPQVWMETGNGFVAVDVMTDSTTFDSRQANTFTLTIRKTDSAQNTIG